MLCGGRADKRCHETFCGLPDITLRIGYDHVINYREQDFVEEVKKITGGRKCDVVYDSVGKDTFPASLDCLRNRGVWERPCIMSHLIGLVPPGLLPAGLVPRSWL